jgi:hypothetical protein
MLKNKVSPANVTNRPVKFWSGHPERLLFGKGNFRLGSAQDAESQKGMPTAVRSTVQKAFSSVKFPRLSPGRNRDRLDFHGTH